MENKILNLYRKFKNGLIGRREFIKRLSILIGAFTLFPLSGENNVRGEITSKDDPRLQTEFIKYPGETGDIRAYFAKPKGDEKLPGVVIIHENRGLNLHFEDVTRRVALERFLAITPDALSPFGGTPGDPDKARELIGKLDTPLTIKNYVAAVKYLKTHPSCTGKVGVIGFCWGGAMANQVAVHSQDVLAVVPFYGRQPRSEDVPKIKASLLLHYAEMDEMINKGIAEYEASLKKASVEYQIYIYKGTKHAFLNDTNPERYHKEAAELAWKRTINFLNEKLRK
jgi:carboxymethylenebutenolidase